MTAAHKTRLRSALRLEERSQAWLARKLNMNESLLSHYLAGRRPAPADLLDRIAAVLGVPVAALREDKSSKQAIAA